VIYQAFHNNYVFLSDSSVFLSSLPFPSPLRREISYQYPVFGKWQIKMAVPKSTKSTITTYTVISIGYYSTNILKLKNRLRNFTPYLKKLMIYYQMTNFAKNYSIMKTFKSFASDNNAPVHPDVMKAILAANTGDTIAYGDDQYTREAQQAFKDAFGNDAKVFFVFTGTGANVLSVSQLTRSFHSVVCATTAHANVDECGAPEKFSGCKLQTLPTTDGKIRVEQIEPLMHSIGFEHHVQPKVISITQATELGTVYTTDEIRTIANWAHAHDMYLHVDGARISNAAASLGVSFKEMITDTGVDILSFGGTKNGLMLGEAVVFLNPILAKDFQYLRKQAMQLASKMRFISSQFSALLKDDLWLKNASHSNKMASLLEAGVKDTPGIEIVYPVQTNGIFAKVPPTLVDELLKHYFFYVWDDTNSIVRWMTSFGTTEQDVEEFVKTLRGLAINQ